MEQPLASGAHRQVDRDRRPKPRYAREPPSAQKNFAAQLREDRDHVAGNGHSPPRITVRNHSPYSTAVEEVDAAVVSDGGDGEV